MKDDFTSTTESVEGKTVQAKGHERAHVFMDGYQQCYDIGEGWQTTLADLLGDLRHWAVRMGVDFDEALGESESNWIAETTFDAAEMPMIDADAVCFACTKWRVNHASEGFGETCGEVAT